MRLSRIFFASILFIFSVFIAGCGGSGDKDGNSETTGTLGAVSASKVGNKIFASVTYSNAIQGLSVTFTNNGGTLVDKQSIEARTNSSGVASAVFTIVGVNTAKRNITISASTGGLKAVPAEIILNAVTLEVTPPSNASKDIESFLDTYVDFIPEGFLATLTDADGYPIQNADVTISVQATLNGVGTAVFFWKGKIIASNSSITIKTDSNGQIPNLATIRVPIEGAPPGGERDNVCTVIWKVSTGDIFRYGTTQLSVNNSVPDEKEETEN